MKRNSCVTQHLCNSNRDFQKMQQLSWKNFPVKIEKSLCKLLGPKYAPNPVHNSVTIYRGEAFSSLWCVKGSFAAPAARRLARRLAPATVEAFSSPGRAIIKSRQSRPEGGFGWWRFRRRRKLLSMEFRGNFWKNVWK